MDVKGEARRGGTEGGQGGKAKDGGKVQKPDKKGEKMERSGNKESHGTGNQVAKTSKQKANQPNQGKTKGSNQNEGKKNKQGRGGKGKKKQEEEAQGEREGRRGRGGRRRQRRLQRVYAWYRCKQCNRHWESSQTRRVIGTVIVPFKQACKECTEKRGVPIFTGPYRTECFECGAPCCDCGIDRERFLEYGYDGSDEFDWADGYGPDYSDDVTPRERHVDEKKPHLSSLCERCLKGFSCVLEQFQEN